MRSKYLLISVKSKQGVTTATTAVVKESSWSYETNGRYDNTTGKTGESGADHPITGYSENTVAREPCVDCFVEIIVLINSKITLS